MTAEQELEDEGLEDGNISEYELDTWQGLSKNLNVQELAECLFPRKTQKEIHYDKRHTNP